MVNDATTGRPLPDSAIQRVLFVANDVHVYQIPPLTSNKGFTASSWTAPPRPTAQEIFVARLRVVETSIDARISTAIVLEDSTSGDLFAAAPYTSEAVVQQATDSSRFFAVRVVGDGGMKATLGIGFEDRGLALDFSIALTDARKVMHTSGTNDPIAARQAVQKQAATVSPRDFSLKEGEKIHVQLGSRSSRPATKPQTQESQSNEAAALFSIAPPPSSSASQAAKDLGFDDGDFGDFQ